MADKPSDYTLDSLASPWFDKPIKLPSPQPSYELPITNCLDCPMGDYVTGCLMARQMQDRKLLEADFTPLLSPDQAAGMEPPPPWCPMKQQQIILYRITQTESAALEPEPDAFTERMKRRREGSDGK